jgi:hypothetical protein
MNDRIVDWNLLFFGLALVSTGIILLWLSSYIPSLIPFQATLLVISGFLLGFTILIAEEVFFFSRDRFVRKKDEKQMVKREERRQKDAVIFGYWSCASSFNLGFTEEFHDLLSGACSRLLIPKEFCDDYAKRINKIEKRLAKSNPKDEKNPAYKDYQELIIKFNNKIAFYLADLGEFSKLSSLATTIWSSGKSMLENSAKDDAFDFLLYVINGYLESYSSIKEKMVGEVVTDFEAYTEKIIEIRDYLIQKRQMEQVDLSILNEMLNDLKNQYLLLLNK